MLELSAHGDAIHGLSWLDGNNFVTGCENGSLLGHDIRVHPGSGSAWSYSLAGLIGGPGKCFYNHRFFIIIVIFYCLLMLLLFFLLASICCLTVDPSRLLLLAGCTDGWVRTLSLRSGKHNNNNNNIINNNNNKL